LAFNIFGVSINRHRAFALEIESSFIQLNDTPIMVRIKYRYLLVHILNPEPALPTAKIVPGPSDKTLPDLVQFHSPSPDDLTPQLLARALRDQVQYLYGDYGLGLVASSLVGNLSTSPTHSF